MADIQILGFIRQVKYLQDSCLVFIDEYKSGYKRSNGEVVDEKFLSWRCIFSGYFKNFISKHFGSGMLMGQTINRASYPKSGARAEMRMVKESEAFMESRDEKPDLDGYNQEDF